MQSFQVRKAMEFLRKKSRLVRKNNPRIDQWVEDYLKTCFLNGQPVSILTQWCISKDLEQRFKTQGNKFIPTKRERILFETELPELISVFKQNGFSLNWWITFNASYLDSGRISRELSDAYQKMINELAGDIDDVLILDWEDDVLEKRPEPNQEVLENMDQFINPKAFELELERHSLWARDEAGLAQSNKELRRDVIFQIACEVEEGRLLTSNKSPFEKGQFLLFPLEVQERYSFFTVLAKDFKKRMASVLFTYPWRM